MSITEEDTQTERHRALKSAIDNHSITDITRQNPDVHLTDGCVILGRHGSTGNTYVTRYYIDHVTQRRNATRDVLHEECVPCCDQENRETAKLCLWNFIKSEAFLFSLHIIALALGAAKEAMDIRRISDDLELIHSLVETFVAFLMITIRMIVNWYAFKVLKDTAYKFEHFSSDSKKLRGGALKHWRNVVIAIGVMMLALIITCFILFKFLVHLGWTILSNNFAMIVFTVVSGLYTSRVEKTRASIREDQHKAVLYESLLLIKETCDPSKNNTKPFREKLIRFMKATEDTSFLSKPPHIEISDKGRFNNDMLISLEMQSLV
jgi:hypothetical protein